MSYTSTLPTNLPKYSVVAVVPVTKSVEDSALGYEVSSMGLSVSDSATSYDFITNFIREVLDSGVGSELVSITRQLLDYGVGTDVAYILWKVLDSGLFSDYSILKLLTEELGRSAEVSKLMITTSELGAGLDTSKVMLSGRDLSTGLELLKLYLMTGDLSRASDITRLLRRLVSDYGSGVELVPKVFLRGRDSGVGKSYVLPMLGDVLPDPTAFISKCVDALDRYYPEVDYGREVKAVHYSVVNDCMFYLLTLISLKLCDMVKGGIRLSDDAYNQLSKCWGLTASYRRPKSMELIQPEHENQLIDMLKCVEDLYSYLPAYFMWVTRDSGVGRELGRYIDITEVADRVVYKPQPIEYFTNQLSPVGGYVLTPPPPFKEGIVVVVYGIRAFIYNTSKGTQIWWDDTWQDKPCTQVSVYSDGWTVAWFEDLCFYSQPDWDWDDSAVAFRVERLDKTDYLHFVVLEKDHGDGNTDCIVSPAGVTCSPNLGSYSGPVRVAYETWIQLLTY